MTIPSVKEVREKYERKIANNVELFIEEHVNIEDKDAPEIIVPFKMWPAQKDALKVFEANKLSIALKARQIGITWLSLAYAAWKMLFTNGYTIVGLSKTEDDAKELVRRIVVILEHMPELIYEKKVAPPDWTGRTYEDSALMVTVHCPNGVDRTFKALTASASAGRSLTANLVIIDEWAFQQFAQEIWDSAFPTINRVGGGKVIGISTIFRGTLFEEIFTGDRGFAKIFIPWYADPRRTLEWYENTKKAMGDKIMQEYPATIEEALTIPGGRYFPDVKGHIHLKAPQEPIPEHYRRYVCIDYGMDMLSAHWVYIDEQKNARVYREYDKAGLTISEAAEHLIRENRKDNIDLWLAPPDLWNNRQETGKSVADIFRENKIILVKTSNNRQNGCMAMADWLRPIRKKSEFDGHEYDTARLTIDEGCAPNLWRSLTKIQKNPNKPNEYMTTTSHELTHDCDSMRCFCVYWTHPATLGVTVETRKWTSDMLEDYQNARNDSERQYILNKYGAPE